MPKDLNLHPFNITRPLKIRWMFDTQATSFLDNIKSKSLKSFLKKTDAHLATNAIELEHSILDAEQYAQWLAYYEQSMLEKKYDIIAHPDWFAQKVAERKKVGGFFLSKNGQWVGSLIYTLQDTQKAIACFKTTQTLPEMYQKNHSLSAILDYVFVEDMLHQNVGWISLGSMRNAFGVINTIGNLDYKLRCGYYPVIKESSDQVESVPLDGEGRATFFGQLNQQLQLFLAHPQNEPFTTELTRFESDIISIKYLPYSS